MPRHITVDNDGIIKQLTGLSPNQNARGSNEIIQNDRTYITLSDNSLQSYNLTSIPNQFKSNDATIKGLAIGNSVTTINATAFYNCFNLTGSLTIPDSVTSIAQYVFYNCAINGSLTIGNFVTSIGFRAFWNCDSLQDIYCNIPASAWANSSLLNCGSVASKIYVTSAYVSGYDSTWLTNTGFNGTVATWTN